MTLTERGNYLIAVLISLTFHLLILLIYIPQYINSQPNIETYPVGLVEVAGGSGFGSGIGDSVAVTETMAAPENPALAPPSKTVEERGTKDKTVIIPAVKSKPDRDERLPIPKKEGIAASKEEEAKAGFPGGSATRGNSGTGTQGNGAGTGTGVGFGTGEGMITLLGPLPPYPKNAMNEGKEGDVAVRILVKADGGLEQVNITKTSGDARLDKVAVGAVERGWRFKPVSQDYYIDLIFSFRVASGVSIKFIYSESRP